MFAIVKETKALAGIFAFVLAALLACALTACGGSQGGQGGQSEEADEAAAAEDAGALGLEPGEYTVAVETDSSMFHLNETCNGQATLTVADGQATVHLTLVSKKIEHLYAGTAAEAQEEGAALIEPTLDTVTYDDGTSKEVYGFDVPVPALDEPFDVAIVGTHGNWYDHKVTVATPELVQQ